MYKNVEKINNALERGITWKLRMGEQSFLCVTCRLDLQYKSRNGLYLPSSHVKSQFFQAKVTSVKHEFCMETMRGMQKIVGNTSLFQVSSPLSSREERRKTKKEKKMFFCFHQLSVTKSLNNLVNQSDIERY